MSPGNADILRELFEAITERDLARLIELTDPEVEWRSFFADLLPRGEYHGHDGLREYLDHISEAWETLRPEVDDVLRSGDVVIGVGRIHYAGRRSGVQAESPAGWMLRLRGTKVLVFRAFKDPAEALAAVGLRD